MAAPTIVNTTLLSVNAGTAQASYTITIPATSSGNQLVLLSNMFANIATAYMEIQGATAPSTNNGDTFTSDATIVAADTGSGNIFVDLEIYRASSVTAGSTSVTVNYLNSSQVSGGNLFLYVAILEISGMATVSPIDGGVQSSTSNATQTLTVTTVAGTGDLLFGMFTSSAGSGPGAPWTQFSGQLNWNQSVATNATTSFTTTSGGSPYVSELIAYKGSAVVPPPIPPIILGQPWTTEIPSQMPVVLRL